MTGTVVTNLQRKTNKAKYGKDKCQVQKHTKKYKIKKQKAKII